MVSESDGQLERLVAKIRTNSFESLIQESNFILDPRVKDWQMMSSPFPTICICLFYAYFNKVLMPKFMAKRKPYDLRNILVVYNLFQTVFSSWIFYEVSEVIHLIHFNYYIFNCVPKTQTVSKCR